MASCDEYDEYWKKSSKTYAYAKELEAVRPGNTWVDSFSLSEIGVGDILMVIYTTDGQLAMTNYDDVCGIVKYINTDKDGLIISITLEIYENQQVDVLYENDKFVTGCYRNIRKLI